VHLGDFLIRASRWFPEKTATVFEDTRMTFAQLNGRVNALSHVLMDMGVKSQDRVAVLCQNSHYFLEAFFGIAKINAVSTNLNWRLSPKELAFVLEDSGANVVFLSRRFEAAYPTLRELAGNRCRFVAIEGSLPGAEDYEALIARYPSEEPAVEVGHEDVVLQMYTSGTTGRPKGVMLSHKNIVANAVNTMIEMEYGRRIKLLSVLPLFHIALYAVLNCVFVGGTTVFLHGFNPQTVLSVIEKEKITRLSFTPAMFALLLEHPDFDKSDLSSVEFIGYASAPMPRALLRRAMEKFKCDFCQSFGMTEMSPVMTVLPPQDHVLDGPEYKVRRLESVGRPICNVQVRVVDEKGAICPPGEVGEIIGRGDTVMKGYHRMPEATAAAIRDGWYYTGDLGYMDEYGYLYIVDRKKDMIISGGENIYPKEVEDVIARLEGVVEVAVIGVPDEIWGESVKGIVVKAPGAELTEKDIIERCKVNMASYKKPKSVDFVTELPKNAMGKVLKDVLRERYWKDKERKV
jgi:long-chain acyl-CoA synthetase